MSRYLRNMAAHLRQHPFLAWLACCCFLLVGLGLAWSAMNSQMATAIFFGKDVPPAHEGHPGALSQAMVEAFRILAILGLASVLVANTLLCWRAIQHSLDKVANTPHRAVKRMILRQEMPDKIAWAAMAFILAGGAIFLVASSNILPLMVIGGLFFSAPPLMALAAAHVITQLGRRLQPKQWLKQYEQLPEHEKANAAAAASAAGVDTSTKSFMAAVVKDYERKKASALAQEALLERNTAAAGGVAHQRNARL